jgi:hypothetical protein
MRRAKKNKIEINESTLERILDECYNETTDLKIELSNLYSIWGAKVVEISEIAVVGKDIIKILDQRDKIIDKKLKIAQQIHNTISERNKLIKENNKEDNSESLTISDEMNSRIDRMIQMAKNKKIDD